MKTRLQAESPSGPQLTGSLVSTQWLEQELNIDRPDASPLRVFDCAVVASPNPDPAQSQRFPFVFESGHSSFESGHIPTAGLVDIVTDLSDQASPIPLMAPSEQQFADAMMRYGINDDDRVVLYSSTEPMWAARIWWMLRAFGFDNAAVLDGGWSKWVEEARPISKDPCTYPPGVFTALLKPGLLVGKQEVLTATANERIGVINALPSAMHSGSAEPVFGRRGRIAGSVNIPSGSLHDPKTGTYLGVEDLKKILDTVGATDQARRTIVYCGGGIASSNLALALTLAGHTNVGVYDASMFEWGNDPALPMEAD